MIDFHRLPGYQKLQQALQQKEAVAEFALLRAVRLPFLHALQKDLDAAVVYVMRSSERALAAFEDFSFWDAEAKKHLFAEPTPIFFEDTAWDAAKRWSRLQTLVTLGKQWLPNTKAEAKQPVIFTTIKALMTRSLPRREFVAACATLKVGQRVQIEDLRRKWAEIGYEFANIVTAQGQFSARGGILDIWPGSMQYPARIEFFGNEIDTVREFDPATQRSIEKKQEIFIPPAREYLPGKAGSEDILKKLNESWIAHLHPEPACLLDYLTSHALIVLDDAEALEVTAANLEKEALDLRKQNGVQPKGERTAAPYLSWSELMDRVEGRALIRIGHGSEQNDFGFSQYFSSPERFNGQLEQFLQAISKQCGRTGRVCVVSKQDARLRELWQELRLAGDIMHALQFSEGYLEAGWQVQYPDGEQICLFTDNEIFGWQRPAPRRKYRTVAIAPEAQLVEFQSGDYVVHLDYGIGIFQGLVKRALEGVEREYLRVEYAENDQLFVPVHQADRLFYYVGPDARKPRLTRLGSQEWQNTRIKVRKAVENVAVGLLELYATRQTVKGFAFEADSPWQQELEAGFPYEETPDQAKAIAEVKYDMEQPKPMDRLLCGDVGYGKTEVALRAAFKAVMSGKQVAMLVPTTVLTQQHFDTFAQRLTPFPVKVEMLSRFRSPQEQAEIITRLQNGEVDIIIGTHRLLQPDVQIAKLGLLILDEEQRFGVMHKEYFKKLRTEIDVLTLTATPIPRTLYMALSGVRDISVINTPPSDRLPIHTHVGGYDSQIIRKAVLREVERGGQVFFVHNRVRTIDAMAAHLRKVVPEVRIAVAHGQMPEAQLAGAMRKFTRGEIDVLLSTSIIESGLDIPNANTLIVDRGDTFGLAQLYQLRGRVGRGAQRAYAYFFYNKKRRPTAEGLERLDVIAENTQLGAGYLIAMRDLEIRGAGELLGTDQHGHIAAVGFHLYTRLLAQAVKQQRGQEIVQKLNHSLPMAEIKPMVTVDLPMDVGIPETYINDKSLRLALYRRMSAAADEDALTELIKEFADRFGGIPVQVSNLIWQLRIKGMAAAANLASITIENEQLVLRYPPLSDGVKNRSLPNIGQPFRAGKNAYWMQLNGRDWQRELESALKQLMRYETEMGNGI